MKLYFVKRHYLIFFQYTYNICVLIHIYDWFYKNENVFVFILSFNLRTECNKLILEWYYLIFECVWYVWDRRQSKTKFKYYKHYWILLRKSPLDILEYLNFTKTIFTDIWFRKCSRPCRLTHLVFSKWEIQFVLF